MEAPASPSPVPHRLAVRLLMRSCGKATLATLLPPSAWPYASLVTVATTQDGCPILLLSGLSDHTRNLAADERVSLLFDGTGGFANPQQGPRVTVLGRAVPDQDPALRQRFLTRHPAAALYAGFGDFAIYRVSLERVHFVGGFGRAVWLEDRLTVDAAIAQALAQAEDALLTEMNQDHGPARNDMAKHLLGRSGEGWRLVALDADGVDLALHEEVARLPFAAPVDGPKAAREALINLAHCVQSTAE